MNFLIRYCVCYISAQVADFMSSVGNRLIGGKSTVELRIELVAQPCYLSHGVTDFCIVTCFECSVLVSGLN